MFIRADTTSDRLLLYRDILAVYKKIIEAGLESYNIDKSIVEVKNTIKKNVNRAPLIVIERSDLQHVPRSLLFGEHVSINASKNLYESSTTHMLEYPIEFTCFGNSYLESEKLGGLVMEAILTTGLAIVKRMHPNIIGSEFIGWGKSGLVEGSDSSLIACKVNGTVFLKVDGYYSIENKN